MVRPVGLVIGGKAHRFDVWVEKFPLAGPVVANGAVTVDTTTFHAVGPIYVLVHGLQGGVDVACVEVLVCGGEEIS